MLGRHASRQTGSPPQTWGRRPGGVTGHLLDRFTPTDVGKTVERPIHLTLNGGSPPQTWGRRTVLAVAGLSARFTPTDVGKTSPRRHIAPSVAVHPHRRGEDGRTPPPMPCGSGSPPQTWGRRRQAHKKCPVRRFTPTDVGKTRGCPIPGRPRAVHPHRRGEDADLAEDPESFVGSPPQTWGRP